MDAGEAVGLKNIGKRRLLHNRQAQRGLDRVRDVVKSDFVLQKQADGLFIGGVHGRAGRAAGLRCLLCKREAREGRLVDRVKRQRAAGQKIERRGRIVRPVRIRHGKTDGDAHIGHAQLRQHGSVDKLHKGMHNRLPVDDGSDLRKRQIIQPHSLDDLQPLVHERCTVNRDFRAHFPVRVAQRVRFGHAGQAFPRLPEKRPAGAGQNQAFNFGPVPAAHEALENGRMLGIDGNNLRTGFPRGRLHDLARADHRLFIGKGDALFFANGRQRGPQRGKAAHGCDDRISLRQSRRFAQRLRARKHPYIHIRQTDF